MIINQKEWYIQSNDDTLRLIQGARWNAGRGCLEPIHADRDCVMIELVNNTAGTGYISFQRAPSGGDPPVFAELFRLDASGNLISGTHYIELGEIGAPDSPATNKLRLYAVDDAGTTKLAYKDSAGAETILS